MLVDSHIHITHHLFDGTVPCIVSEENEERIQYFERSQLFAEFKKHQIAFCVEPGIELESNYRILEIAKKFPDFIFPAVGVHPTRTLNTKWEGRKLIEQLSQNDKVVAIGELGLDYHFKRSEQHRIKQILWFIWQLRLACKRKLPLILHIRLADHDAIRILRVFKKRINGGVCHCFNGGADIAKIYTEEFGFMLGIGGSLLQSGCNELENAVINTPLEYLVLETDGPYVKPEKPENLTGKKWRKARNTSLILRDVAQRIAELKGISLLDVEIKTTENAMRLFNIDIPCN